jgi:hypothetical protein
MYTAYMVTYAEVVDFIRQSLNIIKIKIRYTAYSFMSLNMEYLKLHPTTQFNWRNVNNTDVWTAQHDSAKLK